MYLYACYCGDQHSDELIKSHSYEREKGLGVRVVNYFGRRGAADGMRLASGRRMKVTEVGMLSAIHNDRTDQQCMFH